MSVHISSRAWTHPVGDPIAKLVYLKLADHANDNGECWPSRRTITRDCEVSISTYKRKLSYLIERGFVAKVERHDPSGRQTSNFYVLPKALSDVRAADVRSDDSYDGSKRSTGEPPEGPSLNQGEGANLNPSPLGADLLKSIDELGPSKSQRIRWLQNPELTQAWIRKAMATPEIRNPAAFVDAQVKNGNEPEQAKPPRPSWKGSGNCTHQGCEGLEVCRFD